MKAFDFNVHPKLISSSEVDVNNAVINEFNSSPDQLFQSLSTSLTDEAWGSRISGFNSMVFTKYFHQSPESTEPFIQKLRRFCLERNLKVEFTFLVDPRFKGCYSSLFHIWSNSGVKFIKFHSYHQKIDSLLIPKCIEISRIAEKFGLGICVDASYGSLGIYRYDNLLLASEILNEIKNTPVLILHAGGLRCLEAALLVSDTMNGYIELSFSPHYYRNTHIYSHFLDLFRLLPATKFLYASDYPYINLEDSLECCHNLLLDAGLSPSELNAVMYENAYKLFSQLA